MDVAELLQSKGDDSPSGENLEYDPVFTDMELAAQPGEETQIGNEITAASDPDYGEVVSKALDVLERSHDLRAAAYYADAILHGDDGLVGFAEATDYMRQCLEEHWDTCHPELDEDDDDDPTMRINAVAGLGGGDTAIKSLRRAALTESRGFGRFSLRDTEIAEGKIPAPADMETVPDSASINAAFQDSDADVIAARLEAVKTAQENVKAIDAIFVEKTPGMGPDLDALTKTLRQIAQTIGAFTGGAVDTDDDAGDDAPASGGGGMSPAVGGGGGGPIGGINSPTDVSNTIDRIIGYYERCEPSSPVPILLARAKRLVNADFLTIMQDMAPQGVENVHLIGGIEDDDDD